MLRGSVGGRQLGRWRRGARGVGEWYWGISGRVRGRGLLMGRGLWFGGGEGGEGG